MCCLLGWTMTERQLAKGDIRTFAAVLAFQAERRGDDSWGAAIVTGKTIKLIREPRSIIAGFNAKDFELQTVMVHTRKATTGPISLLNTHPFTSGHIIGAHNGFVFNHRELNQQYDRKHECDSPHIFDHIAGNLPIEELDAMGTITYINTEEPGRIYIARSTSSEMTIMGLGTHDKPEGIVWCSVDTWLKNALKMSGFTTHFEYKLDLQTRYYIENNQLFDDGDFPMATKAVIQHRYEQPNFQPCTPNPYKNKYEWDNDVDRKNKEFWSNYRNNPHRLPLTPEEASQLSESLKKTGEILNVAGGETQKAITKTEQCTGCRVWDTRLDRYESNGSGVVYNNSAGQTLCYECHLWWGEDTNRVLSIPALRTELNDTFLH